MTNQTHQYIEVDGIMTPAERVAERKPKKLIKYNGMLYTEEQYNRIKESERKYEEYNRELEAASEVEIVDAGSLHDEEHTEELEKAQEEMNKKIAESRKKNAEIAAKNPSPKTDVVDEVAEEEPESSKPEIVEPKQDKKPAKKKNKKLGSKLKKSLK